MLGETSSREMAEWMAYEQVVGPFDNTWRDETLSVVLELLQSANHLHGAAHFTDKKHPDNPVPEPKRWIRPWEAFEKSREVQQEAMEKEDRLQEKKQRWAELKAELEEKKEE